MIKHGTGGPSYYAYKKLHCRCIGCKAANAKYKSTKVAHNKSVAASGMGASDGEDTEVRASHIPHGRANSYDWYGCRCEECRKAESRQRKLNTVKRLLKGDSPNDNLEWWQRDLEVEAIRTSIDVP